MNWENNPINTRSELYLIDNPCPEHHVGCPGNDSGFCLVEYNNKPCTTRSCGLFWG